MTGKSELMPGTNSQRRGPKVFFWEVIAIAVDHGQNRKEFRLKLPLMGQSPDTPRVLKPPTDLFWSVLRLQFGIGWVRGCR